MINSLIVESNKKYSILIQYKDTEKLNNIVKTLSKIGFVDVQTTNSEEEALSKINADKPFDMIVCEFSDSSEEFICEIRKKSTSAYVLFVVDKHQITEEVNLIMSSNVQGFCLYNESCEEIVMWLQSGTRLLEQTKILKKLYLQTKRQSEVIKELNSKIIVSYYDTVDTLRKAVDAKDPYTRGHSDRVGYLAYMIASELNITGEDLETIKLGATFHDIGKIGIKDMILTKPGKLTVEEFDEIKKHPVIGFDLLEKNTIFKNALSSIRNHHERYDGKGYPDGLVGEEIPYNSRIVAVADAFDAMMSKRSYREKLELDYTLTQIEENKGTQFDPEIADVFIKLIKSKYAEIEAHFEEIE